MGSTEAAIALGLSVVASTCVAAAQPDMTDRFAACTLDRGALRAVVRVVDGETLALDDGAELRLIGALAPRALDVGAEPGQWPPELATIAVLKTLVVGKSVRIWHDRVRTDRYGRVLGHAVVIDPSVSSAGMWIQGTLVELGLARAYSLPGNDACITPLLALEQAAHGRNDGLWRNAAYAPRIIGEAADLVRDLGSFQIVSGTVQRVSGGRGRTYLSLEPRRPRGQPFGFSVLVGTSAAALPEGVPARNLKGRRVHVRGWIESRRGPVISVDSAGQLVIDDHP